MLPALAVPAAALAGKSARAGGRNTPRDMAKALEMYEKAALNGREDAARALVELYAEKDPGKAAYWKAKLERTPCCR